MITKSINIQILRLCFAFICLSFYWAQISVANISYAHASCTDTVDCREKSNSETQTSISKINEYTTQEFQAHRAWWISIVWEDNILPALMLMANQLSAMNVKQTEMVGMFFDAKHQMETQTILQEHVAQAHKDYQPSTGMCVIGSSVKSLAASERIGEVNAVVLAQRSIDRGLGNANTMSATGEPDDTRSRVKQFRETYCDISDNGGKLDSLCDHDQQAGGNTGGQDPLRLNKDIDYMATLVTPWTLNVNFTDGASTATGDEEDVLALATNLYSAEVFRRPPTGLSEGTEDDSLNGAQLAYMNARALLAKRSVAENSYNAIVGMKSAGTAGSRDFLQAILAELGVDDATENVNTYDGNATALDHILGDNPSYHAQMEVLTKKIYQDPDFYTNLYDKPANVARKGVALQAIGLMQKFDLLKSNLRNEASQSILLELAVQDLQTKVEQQLPE